MLHPDLLMIHGLYVDGGESLAAVGEQRTRAFERNADALGVRSYEWVDGRRRRLVNYMLRLMRGTARAVDAVEIIALDEAAVRASLAGNTGRELWRRTAGSETSGLDAARSFLLIGAPRRLLEGSGDGQRVLWFGNGLEQLSREEFVDHYTNCHGPLVAAHAGDIGLRSYRQVPGERPELSDCLCSLGIGQAPAPAVFAELVMGRPPIGPAGLVRRRAAAREIAADEKRHIDFQRSMLILTG